LNWSIGREVRGRVRLCVDADEAEVENEWEDGGQHQGSYEREEAKGANTVAVQMRTASILKGLIRD